MSGHPPILISACLLGQPVRFDGQGKPQQHEVLERWRSLGCLVPLCPEVAGGLGVPRPPAEIQPGAERQEAETGLGQFGTALARQHGVEPVRSEDAHQIVFKRKNETG